MLFGRKKSRETPDPLEQLAQILRSTDTILIGAGAGLSAAAGFVYGGERFRQYFADFGQTYGFSDMYSGGFYPFPDPETFWAFWSRNIRLNRYTDPPKPVYETLLKLVRDKDYFVLTTNVDHCFQKAGFDKKRLFYTQGDYGLFQCAQPCRQETWDNEDIIRRMTEEQMDMRIPSELIPKCPNCGGAVTTNLRVDDRFVEDAGWHMASERYAQFVRTHGHGRILYWELGVGYNTPVIIKYPFWRMTYQNPDAFYACINLGETDVPKEITARSVCVDGDIGAVLEALTDALSG